MQCHERSRGVIQPSVKCGVLFVLAVFAGVAVDAVEPMPAHASFTIDSALLKEVRRINVYTPPGYDAAKAAR